MKVIHGNGGRRLRVRRVDEEGLLDAAIKMAVETKKPRVKIQHGGSVANAYNYPAETEGVVAIGLPNGDGYAEVVRIPANKVTHGGVFASVFKRGPWDARYGHEKQEQVLKEFVAWVLLHIYLRTK